MLRIAALLSLLHLAVGLAPASAGFELVETYRHPDRRGYFGWTLHVHDGRLYVAAPFEERDLYDFTVQHGSVYEIDLAGRIPMRRLVAPDSSGTFGVALAVAGNTLFVGASSAHGNGWLRGNLHEFSVPTGAFLRSSADPADRDGDLYGFALATDGRRLVVSAPNSGAAPTFRPLLYVYDAPTGALERTIEDPESSAPGFGSRLLIVGDLLLASSGFTEPGFVRVFSVSTGAYLRTLHPPDPEHTSSFGWSLAPIGNAVAIGAPHSWNGNGAVYLVDPATGDVIREFYGGDAGGAAFGWAVAGLGDRLVVGAPGGSDAFVFDVGTGALVARLRDRNFDAVGYTLAATRNEVFVRAWRWGENAVLRFASTCGNGALDPDELCDDGNLLAGDACAPDCRPSVGVCERHLDMVPARLDVRTPAGNGTASLSAAGRLKNVPDPERVLTSATTDGAGVVVIDGTGRPLLDLAERGTPIPGGPRGCGPRDGWRVDARGYRAVYTNRSGALPPSCAPGSAQGLTRLELRRGRSRNVIDVHLKVAGAAFPAPTLPLGLTVALDGNDETATCASRRFDADDCRPSRADDALFCRADR